MSKKNISILNFVWKVKKECNKEESVWQVKKEYKYRRCVETRKTVSKLEGVWQVKKDYKKSIIEEIKKERNKESVRQVKKEYEYRWSNKKNFKGYRRCLKRKNVIKKVFDKSRKTKSIIEGGWKINKWCDKESVWQVKKENKYNRRSLTSHPLLAM